MRPTLALLATLSLTLSCAKPAASPVTPTAHGTDADLAAVMRGDPAFAANLYANVEAHGNVLVSPMSARVALAMAYAGARGGTATEMATALALDPSPQRDDLGFARLLTTLAGESDALQIVDNLWAQKGCPFDPSFVERLEADYAAPFTPLDFAQEPDSSRLAINAFIADRTGQKIQNFLRRIERRTRLVLTNAVYFKAKWAEPFAASDTADGEFFASPSSSVRAKLMTGVHNGAYAKVDGAQVAELPYNGGHMAMVVVLPDARDGLGAIERSLTGGSLAAWTKGLRPEELHVTLPRFTLSHKASLKESLRAMGMRLAFDGEKADFSGIDGGHDLAILDVIQQTFIAVDEEGTEAAAATAVTLAPPPSAPVRIPIELRADHPFLFLLEDTATGAIVFIGRVVDPTT